MAAAPSPITKPSRLLSNGRLAVMKSSFLSLNAFMFVKPPTEGSFTLASEPPETMASALPKRMRLKASINAWVEDAQAETVQ